VTTFLHELGGISLFFSQVVRTAIRTRGNMNRIHGQIVDVTWRSLSTVVFAGIFVGAILVLQFSQILNRYDASVLLGGLNTSAIVREVGPLLISFLLAGKIGAYTAAELGTMRITEQIDAVQCLGTNPIQYLVVPRFVGIVVSSLILLVIGLVVSILGSMVVAAALCDVNPLQFAQSVPRYIDGWTVAGGLFKSFVFGTIVATVSCFKGYTASGGARGVGRAVTMAAVYTNLFMVLSDFATSAILEWVQSMVMSITGGAT